MSRTRIVFGKDGATRTYVDGVLVDGVEPTQHSGPTLMPDLDVAYGGAWKSPIDDTWISSRSQLREHNKRHGVIQSGDLRGEAFKQASLKRQRYNPASMNQNGFSWSTPRTEGRSGGNLTEV